MRNPKLLTALILLVFVAVGGWTGWWFFVATLTERYARAAAEEGSQPRLAFQEIERFGFPLTVGLRLKQASASGPWLDGDARLETPLAVLTTRPWRPRAFDIDLPEGFGYAATGSSPVSGESGPATGMAGQDPLPMLTLNMQDVLVRPAGAGPLKARYGQLSWRFDAADARKLSLDFTEIALADDALFGPRADRASALMILRGQPSPLSGQPDDIARWRDGKGQVEVVSAAVDWGALDLRAKGALGLDAGFRLAGGLNLQIAEGGGAIDRLTEVGALEAKAAVAAKAFLAFAALASGGGRAAAPVTFADGEAAIAGFPIARLSPVCACR